MTTQPFSRATFRAPTTAYTGYGNEGVQWNAGYYPCDIAVWLGVNLEGMKYDDWPVARLIEREISRPLLLTRYRRKVARPDKVTVLWARDAWQYSARRRIKEANIAPTPIALDRLDGQGWADALRGARECLNPGGHQKRGYGRHPLSGIDTIWTRDRHPTRHPDSVWRPVGNYRCYLGTVPIGCPHQRGASPQCRQPNSPGSRTSFGVSPRFP